VVTDLLGYKSESQVFPRFENEKRKEKTKSHINGSKTKGKPVLLTG
jgi:hypothetical protein